MLAAPDDAAAVPRALSARAASRRRFAEADLVLAKGQGNYETLSNADADIFFILKAKCPVIARDLGCRVGSLILRRHRPAGLA